MSTLNDSLLMDIESILGIEHTRNQDTTETTTTNEEKTTDQGTTGIETEGGTMMVVSTVRDMEGASKGTAIMEETEKGKEKETKMEKMTTGTTEQTDSKASQCEGFQIQSNRVRVDNPLGYERENFLTRDLKSACVYAASELAPRLRQVITKNREKFEVLFQLADSCNSCSIRTCTNYNQGLFCGQGDCHLTREYTRAHCCMLCWEGIWILAPHRLVDCPFLKPTFWEKLGISNY